MLLSLLMKKQLILKIKEKKELSGIEDSVVEKTLNNYLEKYRINFEKISKKEMKLIVKEVRAVLRNIVGQYRASLKSKEKLLNSNSIHKLLSTHSSTKERMPHYTELKEKISEINPKSILDLGCGLNPIALANKKIKYYASDINEEDLEIIKKYFSKNKFKGQVFVHDLTQTEKTLPKADLCLLFKVLDVIDTKNHTLSKEIIIKTPCKAFLVSFATKKLSGKSMSSPKRFWFENLLMRLKIKFEKFSTNNEVFYFFKKLN